MNLNKKILLSFICISNNAFFDRCKIDLEPTSPIKFDAAGQKASIASEDDLKLENKDDKKNLPEKKIRKYNDLLLDVYKSYLIHGKDKTGILDDFKSKVLDVYYPRANVLTKQDGLLALADSDQLKSCIYSIIEMIDSRPWVYIKDKKSDLYSECLSNLAAEIEKYFEFVDKRFVDPFTKITSDKKCPGMVSLKAFWAKQNGYENAYMDLLTLRFCYQIRKLASLNFRGVFNRDSYWTYSSTYRKLERMIPLFSCLPKRERIAKETLKAYQRINSNKAKSRR